MGKYDNGFTILPRRIIRFRKKIYNLFFLNRFTILQFYNFTSRLGYIYI